MLNPLNKKLVIRPDIEKETESGILLAQETLDKERPITGVVVNGNGIIVDGTRVVFSKFGFDEIELEGEKLYIVSDFNVLATIT